jgi:hypothetical protein
MFCSLFAYTLWYFIQSDKANGDPRRTKKNIEVFSFSMLKKKIVWFTCRATFFIRFLWPDIYSKFTDVNVLCNYCMSVFDTKFNFLDKFILLGVKIILFVSALTAFAPFIDLLQITETLFLWVASCCVCMTIWLYDYKSIWHTPAIATIIVY